jgi:hypothetical protein
MYEPGFIQHPTTQRVGTRVRQSTGNPCATNTLSVSLQTNVPIYQHCTPFLTVTGLRNSSTPDNSITSFSASFTSSAPNRTWTRATGILVIRLYDINDAFSSDANGTTRFDFSFELRNPSCHQDAPGVKVELSYNSGSKSIWANEYGSENLFVDAEIASDLTNPAYPMKIIQPVVSSVIAQSSPYPCDENT